MTFEFAGEMITVIGKDHFLVASHSHPGEHYAVDEEGCSCRAADCYVECRHLKAIRKLLSLKESGVSV